MSDAPLLTVISSQSVAAPRAVAMAGASDVWALEAQRAKRFAVSRRTGAFTLVNDLDLAGMAGIARDIACEAAGTVLVAGDAGLMRADPATNARSSVSVLAPLVSVAARSDGAFAFATSTLIRVATASGTVSHEIPETGVLRLDWDYSDQLHVATATSVRVYAVATLVDEYGFGDHTGIRAVANDAFANGFLVDDGLFLTAYAGEEFARRIWTGFVHDDVALAGDGLMLCSTAGNLVRWCQLDYQSRGPRGATGPAGPQGPSGPAGSAGGEGDSALFHHMILGGM